MSSGISFTSVCINTAIYLPWLVSQCLKNGVVFRRAILRHISEAVDFEKSGKKADLIVNCTGLGSLKLGGVVDNNLIPARGQITVVRNSPGLMISTSGTDDADDEVLYIMERAAGMLPLRSLHSSLLTDSRWRYRPRRMLPKGQLGISARSKSCCSNHEEMR